MEMLKKSLLVSLCLLAFVQVMPAQHLVASRLDSLINDAITRQAFPGAQLYVYYRGDTLINKSYGYHTYDSITAVNNQHLYDLASLTKVLAGTLSVMGWTAQGFMDPDDSVGVHFPALKNTSKGKQTLREVMAHQAGWLPYISHQNTVFTSRGRPKSRTISPNPSKRYPYPVDTEWYVHKNYPKKIAKRIARTPVVDTGTYKYSGLLFFLLPDWSERVLRKPWAPYVQDEFYLPIGADRLTFRPLERFKPQEIVPTEVDTLFRKKLVHGTVHDEAASMMGGVSGNAGLFGNAHSVAQVAHLLLARGSFKSTSMLPADLVDRFTAQAYPGTNNRRGIGFDKPEDNYPSSQLSPESYGHTGFTGTFFWVDPKNDFVVVLLTNRVYPSRSQQGLYDLGIRRKMIDMVLANPDQTIPVEAHKTDKAQR